MVPHYRTPTLPPRQPTFGTRCPHNNPPLSIQGKLVEAEGLYKRSLTIDEKVHGPDHPAVASGLNNLAVLLHSQVRIDTVPSYCRAFLGRVACGAGSITAVRDSSRNEPPCTLVTPQGNYGEAQELMKRSLAIRENKLGPDHLDVAESLNNLAGLLCSQVRIDLSGKNPTVARVGVKCVCAWTWTTDVPLNDLSLAA